MIHRPNWIGAVLLGGLGMLSVGAATGADGADEQPDGATAETTPVQMTARQRSAETAALRRIEDARNLMSMGQVRRARDVFHAAIKSLELNFGADDLRLVDPLRGVARTYKLERRSPKESVKALQRVVQIYEVHESEVGENERLNAYLQLGDAAVFANRQKAAADAYARAWQVMSEQSSAEEANDFFASPEVIDLDVPSFNPVREIEENVIVAVGLIIDVKGRARMIEFEELPDPAKKMQRDIKRGLTKAFFRPVAVDGALTDSPRMRMRLAYPRTGGRPLMSW